MSEWFLKSKNEVQHENGYKLTLNAGCWKQPQDIRPTIPKDLKLNPLEIVRQMREGLQCASENASKDPG